MSKLSGRLLVLQPLILPMVRVWGQATLTLNRDKKKIEAWQVSISIQREVKEEEFTRTRLTLWVGPWLRLPLRGPESTGQSWATVSEALTKRQPYSKVVLYWNKQLGVNRAFKPSRTIFLVRGSNRGATQCNQPLSTTTIIASTRKLDTANSLYLASDQNKVWLYIYSCNLILKS